MNNTFISAFIISISVHAAAILPLCGVPSVEKAEKKDMVVDYVILKEESKPKNDIKDMTLKIPETPKIELKPKVEAAANAPVDKTESDKDAPREMAARQALVKTTKDYIGYYQLIREKIRSRIKRNYKSNYTEGEVRLNFILSSSGSLISSTIDEAASSADRTLRDIALSSLREASPFAPFPKTLSLPKMTFDVTIVFKKDR